MDIGFVWDETKYHAVVQKHKVKFYEKGNITMNTIKDEELNYQTYTRDNAPDPAKIQRGYEARRQRSEAARSKHAVQIDDDILNRFQQMTSDSQSFERAINQALREWLSTKDMKELIRGEFRQMVQQTLSAMQVAA